MDTFSKLLAIPDGEYFDTYPIKKLAKCLEKYGKEKCWKALLLAYLFHDYDQHWNMIEQWGKQTNIDFTELYQTNLNLSMEELQVKQQKRQKGWQQQEQTLRNKIHALYFKLPYQVGIWNWKSKKHLLKVLSEESNGRKACRLVGVSLKDIEYIPEQILQKLRGKKAELDTLLPEFSLSEQESQFLETYKKVYQRKVKEPIPTELLTQTGLAATFLKSCIEVAIQADRFIAAAAFITATLKEEIITLPLFHTECQTIIKRVSKQQDLLGFYEVDKAQRQIRFGDTERNNN